MNDDLHTTAEKFLREYLAQTGSKTEPVLAASPMRCPANQIEASKAAATDFIKTFRAARKSEADANKPVRYELEEAQQVLLARKSLRCLTYFYGFKRGLPVFTHDKALAMVINTTGSDELARLLQKDGIETFALTAPEVRKGSL